MKRTDTLQEELLTPMAILVNGVTTVAFYQAYECLCGFYAYLGTMVVSGY
jgi:hypothetical protein